MSSQSDSGIHGLSFVVASFVLAVIGIVAVYVHWSKGRDRLHAMLPEERRKRPAHHIVHDYANLISSAEMVVTGFHRGVSLYELKPLNSHVAHMFYTNCRKMYEFFTYPPPNNPKYDDMRAREFTQTDNLYTFNTWTRDIHEHMNRQLMHMARDRTSRTREWNGHTENPLFRDEFQAAWRLFIGDLRPECRTEFREEIEEKLTTEFSDCDLGKRFIK